MAEMKQKLRDNNYSRFIFREGVLLDDELWVHPATIEALLNNKPNNKYIFVFKEVYLNEWSSTQTMRRSKELNKEQVKFLQSVGAMD